MDTISKILNFNEKIVLTNSTNFIDETLDKISKLDFILNLAKKEKYNIFLFALIKLDCVYVSECEQFGMMKSNINHYFKKLENLKFIERVSRTEEMWDNMRKGLNTKSRDFNKMKFYKLTNLGFQFISKKEIWESLLILIDKKAQAMIMDIFKRRCQ